MLAEPPSRAGEYFKNISETADKAAFLRALIGSSPPTFEEAWLDFKGAAQLSDAQLPKIWSKALGSMDNREGGILIWGIDARKDPQTGLDAKGQFAQCLR